MCTEGGNCPGKRPILVRCQWPYSARPKTHAWLWNHQEQLVSPDVSHPGQEIQAESQQGRKWADYACQCVVFETPQIMTTQPCAINVDQLRVIT